MHNSDSTSVSCNLKNPKR
uniref:Uncharacterized protein n=1 Tax=Rhizophora mucronata TaxID=61149 RepID=A0A2P2ND88_RHIMU